jgi:hypothetical protein
MLRLWKSRSHCTTIKRSATAWNARFRASGGIPQRSGLAIKVCHFFLLDDLAAFILGLNIHAGSKP